MIVLFLERGTSMFAMLPHLTYFAHQMQFKFVKIANINARICYCKNLVICLCYPAFLGAYYQHSVPYLGYLCVFCGVSLAKYIAAFTSDVIWVEEEYSQEIEGSELNQFCQSSGRTSWFGLWDSKNIQA